MTVYDYNVKNAAGEPVAMSEFQGDLLLIVNTATKCGLAPQLEGLEALYQKYQDQGFKVLGFPSNSFLQEPEDGKGAAQACAMKFGTSFPMFDKVAVNGPKTDPLFTYLKDASGNGVVKWNYTKFLVDRDGNFVKRFAPTTEPADIEESIQAYL
ncbi:glutathione peroxidase [Aerococcus agrisoli]|uniref:Glutathione peroxidase n=1 Tax=Aerococcus agrisoli TaxID=2487350 RepID=A0A3N4GGU3_9LACT|nr:glutathione peroxidase [Aerococcus agrisoli]RPA61018.1 glutathione peroxidase [Aerococcus agrisoli]